MEFKNRTAIVGAIIWGTLIFGVGFFAGMEYKAYQIRSAISDGMKQISGIMGGEKSDTANQSDPIKAATTNTLREKVDMEIVSKTFEVVNYRSYNKLGFKFSNKTDKDVRGVTGVVVFYDIFNKEIYRSDVSYDKPIPVQESKIFLAGIDYNQFLAQDIRFKSIELENLKYVWLPSTVIYEDGTQDTE